ncbi:MAG: DNA recombination protein RmuC [Xanthomonadales bacterium]|nr:DNA recombination protein RmuC [Xanthomonadales bacterium]
MNGSFVITPMAGLAIGLLAGLLLGGIAALLAWRSGRRDGQASLQADLDAVRERGDRLAEGLESERRARTVAETRLEEQARHFEQQKATLEAAEKRLNETFERLAGRVFEDRAKKLGELNEKQIDTLLKPLGEKLNDFRRAVTESHQEETKSHAALRERLLHLEKLNERLNEEARNLTRALTADSKAQGNWGEQQLERLLEVAGLHRGREFSTQVSVTTESGAVLRPDLVLHVPGEKSIVMDSKVSLTAWARLQASEDEDERALLLKEHVKSIRTHVRQLGEKRYGDAPELNALDFVLMFVPIEAAMIAALHADPELPAYALEHRVALMSPTNLIATTRTVAAIWAIHRQNTNARDIADRAGKLYDKFVGFVENLQEVGSRLRQAQQSYEKAQSQLSEGPGNLVRQTQLLSDLGARHAKQLDSGMIERAEESGDDDNDDGEGRLRIVKGDREE